MREIRFATEADSAALLGIYAQYIDTPVTFEYGLPDEAEFARRIAGVLAAYPYLVCEEDGRIVGYAYAHRQKAREAYQWNVELSVYLDRAAVSRGIGSSLYRALMELLALQGVKTAHGVVTIPNEKSERLHRSMGFRRVGVHRSTGYKSGGWRDVCLFEKQLAPCEGDPAPVLPIGEIPPDRIEAVLQRYRAE